MFRRTAGALGALSLTAALSVGMASPALASSDAVAGLPGGVERTAATTVTLNNNAPASTFARVTYTSVNGGINISRIVLIGKQVSNGCTKAIVKKNGSIYRQTAQRCFSRGTTVQATFTNLGFQRIGSTFVLDFLGNGAPAGTEAFRVVRA